jgi:hypothetical protein
MALCGLEQYVVLFMNFVNKLLVVDNFFFFEFDQLKVAESVLLYFLSEFIDFIQKWVQDITSTVKLENIGVFVDIRVELCLDELSFFKQIINEHIDLFSYVDIINFNFAFVDSVNAVDDRVYFVEVLGQLHRAADKRESFLISLGDCHCLAQLFESELVDDKTGFEVLNMQVLPQLGENFVLDWVMKLLLLVELD